MSNNAIVPVDQKTVSFYDDQIVAVRLENGEVYVPVRPICELLGVDWAAQTRRMRRDLVLAEEVRIVAVTATNSLGGNPNKLCLPLKYISGFLFGINASRVKPEVTDKLVRYQRECYEVLNEAFQEGGLTSEPTFLELLEGDSPAAQAYKMANAIMKMARQQLLLESQLNNHEGRLSSHEQRLELIENQLGHPDRHITPDQAMQISQAVKAIAVELGKRSGRNEYGGVYGELYRRYSINSYKTLPVNKFEDALNWLNQWLQSLTDVESPF